MTTPTDTWTYSYNALNERVATTHNGQLTTNLVDPTGLGNVVGTYDSSGNLVANYTYGLGLVSQVAAGSKNYYDFDALGSTAGLTGLSGAVLNTYSYLPFGGTLNSTGTAGNPFQFVGQWGVQASGNGLDLMGARACDPSTGRFISQDPLNVLGSGANLYDYAGNNPVGVIDPTGMFKTWQFFVGATGYVGGLAGIAVGGSYIYATGGVGALLGGGFVVAQARLAWRPVGDKCTPPRKTRR